MFTDVMVDLETTGTQPDRHGIIQISAVKFNLLERTVDHEFFDRCLFLPPHRSWSEGTRSWWMQRKETLRGIFDRMECPRLVMTDFVQWCGHDKPRFWSKPLSFDYPFVSSYVTDLDLMMPFNFWEAMDMRSFLRGRAGHPDLYQDADIPFEGVQHNALFDTLHQVKLLFHHMENPT